MVWPRLNDSRITIFRSLLFTGSLGGMLRDSKQKIVAEAKAARGMGRLLGRLFYLEITLQCDITVRGLNHAPSVNASHPRNIRIPPKAQRFCLNFTLRCSTGLVTLDFTPILWVTVAGSVKDCVYGAQRFFAAC